MILDELLEFADATSVAAAAGTALIGDVVDLGAAHRDIGNGQPAYLVITIDTAVVAASAGGVSFSLVSDAQAAIAVDGSATVHYTSPVYVSNAGSTTDPKLKAGATTFCVALPLEGNVYERYLGVLCITTTTTTTAGKINAFITLDPTGWQSYADGAH
jgi:hypothetical protein